VSCMCEPYIHDGDYSTREGRGAGTSFFFLEASPHTLRGLG
jgi:hypothetical protein